MSEVDNINKTFSESLKQAVTKAAAEILQEDQEDKKEILKEGENIRKVTHTYTDYESKINKE